MTLVQHTIEEADKKVAFCLLRVISNKQLYYGS